MSTSDFCDDWEDEEEDDLQWCGGPVDGRFDKFIADLQNAGFQYLGTGSFRTVYARGNVVIKIPIVNDGFIDNLIEHTAYHHYFSRPTRQRIRLAPCRLLRNGCLMMRKVVWEEHHYHNTRMPKWVDLIDGSQVGPYKGKIVAYDYALDLIERFKWEKELGIKSKWFHSSEWRHRNAHINSYLTNLENQRLNRKYRKAG